MVCSWWVHLSCASIQRDIPREMSELLCLWNAVCDMYTYTADLRPCRPTTAVGWSFCTMQGNHANTRVKPESNVTKVKPWCNVKITVKHGYNINMTVYSECNVKTEVKPECNVKTTVTPGCNVKMTVKSGSQPFGQSWLCHTTSFITKLIILTSISTGYPKQIVSRCSRSRVSTTTRAGWGWSTQWEWPAATQLPWTGSAWSKWILPTSKDQCWWTGGKNWRELELRDNIIGGGVPATSRANGGPLALISPAASRGD